MAGYSVSLTVTSTNSASFYPETVVVSMLLKLVSLLSRSFISLNCMSAPLYDYRNTGEILPLPIQPWLSAAFDCSIIDFSIGMTDEAKPLIVFLNGPEYFFFLS